MVLLASVASVAAFVHFFRANEILLYGDAVAHINIARRVFDSRTPGLLQLGTVWLPLPHLLMLPLVIPDTLWRSGAGASLVSMVSYIAGALGVFRLLAMKVTRSAAWFGTLLFLLNPNLLYMQSTAMTEPLAIALFVWSLVYLVEFASALDESVPEAAHALQRCAVCLFAAMLTRYDGWFAAAFIAPIAFFLTMRAMRRIDPESRTRLARALRNFVLLTAAAPALWLGCNFGVFQNALAFANGPYSAHALAERAARHGEPSPGKGSLPVAARYYVKSARLDLGGGEWWQSVIFLCSLAGFVIAIAHRQAGSLALAWLPFLFHALSIAYGSVPLYVPTWWPFSYYNLRYGLELLPAVVIFVAVFLDFLFARVRSPRSAIALGGIAVAASLLAWRSPVVCLEEARANSVSRIALEAKLAEHLSALPASSTLLMSTGEHVGALQRAGFHLSRVIQEGNFPEWQPALAHPAQAADFVLAVRGDAVWQAVERHPQMLEQVAHIEVEGQPEAYLYRSLARP